MSDQNLLLTHLVRKPGEASEKPPLLLLLHGYGSNEHDLFSFAPYLDPRFLIVSARGPVMMMPGMCAWFNIEFAPTGIIPDLAQFEQSLLLLGDFLDELPTAYQIDPRRVYLVGFSQGAMMSLSLALTQPDRVAGVVAMSGRLPEPARAAVVARKDLQDKLKGKPVLVTHGVSDDLIPVQKGRDIRDLLETLGTDLTYKEYAMGHEVRPEAFRDIREWLSKTLDRGNEATD